MKKPALFALTLHKLKTNKEPLYTCTAAPLGEVTTTTQRLTVADSLPYGMDAGYHDNTKDIG